MLKFFHRSFASCSNVDAIDLTLHGVAKIGYEVQTTESQEHDIHRYTAKNVREVLLILTTAVAFQTSGPMGKRMVPLNFF